jgi:ATP-binding cassette subfamily C protein CydD
MVDKRLIRQFLLLVSFAVSGGILAVLQAEYLAEIQNGVFLEMDWTGVWQWD